MFSPGSSDQSSANLSSTWWKNCTDRSVRKSSIAKKDILHSDISDTIAKKSEQQWWNNLTQQDSLPINNRSPPKRRSEISLNITAGENDSATARNKRLTIKRRAKKIENRFLQTMSDKDWKRQSRTLLNQHETVMKEAERHEYSKNSTNEESVETEDKLYLFKRKLRSAKYRFSKAFDHPARSPSVHKRESGSIENVLQKNKEQCVTSVEKQKSHIKNKTRSSKGDTHPSETIQMDKPANIGVKANEPSENEQYLVNTSYEEKLEETNQYALRSQKRLFQTTERNDLSHGKTKVAKDQQELRDKTIENPSKKNISPKIHKTNKTRDLSISNQESLNETPNHSDVIRKKRLFKKPMKNKRNFLIALNVENAEETSVNKEQLSQVGQRQDDTNFDVYTINKKSKRTSLSQIKGQVAGSTDANKFSSRSDTGNAENSAWEISRIDETEEQQNINQEIFLNEYGLIKNKRLFKTPAEIKRQFSQAFNVESFHEKVKITDTGENQSATLTPKETVVDKHLQNLSDYDLTKDNQQGQEISDQENSKGNPYDFRNKKRLFKTPKLNKRKFSKAFINETSQIKKVTRNSDKDQLPQDVVETDRTVPEENLGETSHSKKESNKSLLLEEKQRKRYPSENNIDNKHESINVTPEKSVDELQGQNRLFKPVKETKRQFSEAFHAQKTHLSEDSSSQLSQHDTHQNTDNKQEVLQNESDQVEGIIAKTIEIDQTATNSGLTHGEKTKKGLFRKGTKTRKFLEAFNEIDDSTMHSRTRSNKAVSASEITSFSTMPSIEESDGEIKKQVLFKGKTRSATNKSDENVLNTVDESNTELTSVKSRRISVIKARSNNLEAHVSEIISPQDTLNSRWFETSLISSTKVHIKLAEDEKRTVDGEESNVKINLQEEALVESSEANKDEGNLRTRLSNKQNLTETNQSSDKRNFKNSLKDNLNNSMDIRATENEEQMLVRGETTENKQKSVDIASDTGNYEKETYKSKGKKQRSRSPNSFGKTNNKLTDVECALGEDISLQTEAVLETNQQSGAIVEEQNQHISRNKSNIPIENSSTKLSTGAEYTRNDQDISLQNENQLVQGPKRQKSKSTRMSEEHIARNLTIGIESEQVSVNRETFIEENNQPTSTQTSKHQNKSSKSERKSSSGNDTFIYKETSVEENLSMSPNANIKNSTINKQILETESNKPKTNTSSNTKSIEANNQTQIEQQLPTSKSETRLRKSLLKVAGNMNISQPRVSLTKINNSIKINSGEISRSHEEISRLRDDNCDFSNKNLETRGSHQKSLVNNQDELKKLSINLGDNESPMAALKKYIGKYPSVEAVKKTPLQMKPLTAYFPKLNTKADYFPSQKITASKTVNKVTKKKSTAAMMIEGKVYRPKKLCHKQRWMSPILYKHFQKKMEKKFEDRTVLQSENLMKQLGESVTAIMKSNKYQEREIKILAQELAKNGVVTTMYDFYNFCEEYLPRLFCDKVIPRMEACKKEPTVPFDPSTLFKEIQY